MSNGSMEYTFLWFIENYSYCWHKCGECLYSPPFTADEPESTSWVMRMYPKGHENNTGPSVYIDSNINDIGQLNSSIDIPALNVPIFISGKLASRLLKLLHLDEMRLQRKDDYLPNDTLTVRCKIRKGEGSVRKAAPIIARTRIAIENISFFHFVDKFTELQPNQRNTAEIHSHLKKECILSSYVYCSEEKIIVEIKFTDDSYILCKQKVSLLDGSGNLIICDEDDIRMDDERKDIQKLILSISKHDILTDKEKYLADDRLTLLCECGFSTGLEFEKIERSQYVTPTASVDLCKSTAVLSSISKHVVQPIKTNSEFPSAGEDIKTLYTNQCLTDVELKTETISFKAHKLVLCVRSPVFYAMLTTDMKERHNNCIQVDDLEDDVVQQLLLFLYSDTVENLHWNNATQLYYAADKYQIGGLKELCSTFLTLNLSVSNVTKLLLLADTHNDTDLKKLVEDFILQHEEKVFGSKEWETFMETNHLLAVKIMHLKYKRKN